MVNSFFLGIDPGKYFFSSTLEEAEGRIVWKGQEFPMTQAGFSDLLDALPDSVTIGVEASGRTDHNLMVALGRWVAQNRSCRRLIRLNPGQTARFPGPYPRRDKTDSSDARNIAEYTRVYADHLVDFQRDESTQAMVRCVTERQRLSEESTAVKNRIREQLLISFPEFTQVFSDPFSKMAQAVLQQVPTALHARKRKALSLARTRTRQRNASLGIDRARRLIELARDSIASATCDCDAEAVLHQLAQLELIQNRIQQIDQRLQDYVDDEREKSTTSFSPAHQIRLADSLPGVALVAASTLVLRAGGIDRYYGGKALAAQWAACPERIQTGVSIKKSRLTQHGDHKARAMLYLCTQAATTFDPAFAFHKWRAIQAGQKPIQAICNCMNRLSRVLHAVITKQKPYEANHMVDQINIHHPELWKTFVEQHRDHKIFWRKIDPKWLNIN